MYVALCSARFVSEFGFQSLPSFETYSEVLSSEDWSRNSDLLYFRQKKEGGNDQVEYMIGLHFNVPPPQVTPYNVSTQKTHFENWLFLSQASPQEDI